MKKITSLFTLITLLSLGAFTQNANAQINKGNFMVGSTLGFSFNTSSAETEVNGTSNPDQDIDETTSTFDITPGIGYFVNDNFMVGVQAEFSAFNSSTEGSGFDVDNTDTKFLAGPFFRYYAPLGVGTNKYFFIDANIGFGGNSVNTGDIDVSSSLIGAGIGPGFTIISSDYIGLEALAKYNYVRLNTEEDDYETTTQQSELDIVFGVQYYFGRALAGTRTNVDRIDRTTGAPVRGR